MICLRTSHPARLVLLAGAIFFASAAARAADEVTGTEFFEKRIRPILVERCYECHSEGKKIKGGLRLDTRAGVLNGGKTGAIVVAGDPEKSLLVEAVQWGNPDLQMPPKERLPDAQIADLVAWVRMGASDPRGEVSIAGDGAKPQGTTDLREVREQFPYAPVKPQVVPEVTDRAWAKSEIDRFVLRRLEAKGLRPAKPADKRSLIRRATYDLTGLPPTVAEVKAFVADDSPGAFAKVVDRLLASPAYGQRYARYWLDLVRYTDSFDARGTGGPMDCAEAWRYRDWVVDAFIRDLPYDEFVRRQIAGDLLTPPSDRPDGIVATGVYAIGNWGGGDADKEKLLTDIVDDQIDLTGRAFLGLTLACARCHDHKFDPISTRDYYALAGIFFSSHILPNVGPKTNGPDMLRIPLAPPEELARRERLKAELAALEKQGGGATYPRSSFAPMREPLRDLRNIPGLHALKPSGKQDTPSATFNTTDRDVAFITIKMPPRSVAVHPPPVGGVAAVFECPTDATVTLEGRLADADPNCGDGIEYRLLHRRHGEESAVALASGASDNGKTASLSAGPLKLAAGDRIELLILPRAEYSCDTTIVDLKITPTDSSASSHDLRAEVLADPFATSTPWHFDQVAPDPRVAKLRGQLAVPMPAAHGLQEGGCPASPQQGVHDVRVHVRGRYDRLGEVVPRGFPRVLASDDSAKISEGSGRAELARWVASAANRMTARVMVNRLWQWHFGEGIVRTPNNFGKLGTPPTHPELLDWLAREFVRSGWSVKAMHRTIMLSAAYQQDSEGDADTMKADPDNLLFGRMNRRRLDAEGIRDSMLAATGELDPARGGPAVKDLNSPRRTLYLMTVRSDRTGYRMLFDAADPTAIVDRRVDSTVAPQALFLMNHPFVTARAQKLAGQSTGSARERMEELYRKLFGRAATEEEIALGLRFIGTRGAAGWEQYCHALLCSNEFVYVD